MKRPCLFLAPETEADSETRPGSPFCLSVLAPPSPATTFLNRAKKDQVGGGTGQLGGMVLTMLALGRLPRETSNIRSAASRPSQLAGRLCGPKEQKLSALG